MLGKLFISPIAKPVVILHSTESNITPVLNDSLSSRTTMLRPVFIPVTLTAICSSYWVLKCTMLHYPDQDTLCVCYILCTPCYTLLTAAFCKLYCTIYTFDCWTSYSFYIFLTAILCVLYCMLHTRMAKGLDSTIRNMVINNMAYRVQGL